MKSLGASLFFTSAVVIAVASAGNNTLSTVDDSNDDAVTINHHSIARIDPWPPATNDRATVKDLHLEYNNIFRKGNRNAASHRWATFLLDRSDQMTESTLAMFFSGFCAVSGSPVRPNDYNRYRLTLPNIDCGYSTGYMHYCCWPCVCDTQDYIRVDTKNVTLRIANGDTDDNDNHHHPSEQRTLQFAVIGNPCDNPQALTVPFIQPFDRRETTIAESATELRCLEDGTLEGATLSDHGYIIISMFFDSADAQQNVNGVAPGAMDDLSDPTPGRMASVVQVDKSGMKQFHDEREYKAQCEDRARNGYNSGMGEIFRKVSAVTPISNDALRLSVDPESQCINGVMID